MRAAGAALGRLSVRVRCVVVVILFYLEFSLGVIEEDGTGGVKVNIYTTGTFHTESS